MKIITNGETIAVTGIPSIGAGDIRIPLASVPASLGDTVQLQRDDGFVLASYTVADYLRHYMDGTALVLTNTPEPVPVPQTEPATPSPTAEEQLRADVDYLAVMTGVTL